MLDYCYHKNMSKAFKKDSDSDTDFDEDIDEKPVVPAGHKNYITPSGAKKLTEECPEVTKTVSWAASNGDRSENADYTYGKKRLREIDRRLRFLAKRIDNMEVVDPQQINSDQVLFGASVKLLYEDGEEKNYSIVGIDEVDLSKGRISWVSPLASALFKAKVGDTVMFRSPSGVKEIEVLKIEFKELP